MWRNYHFGVIDEDSDLCGEEFFVAVYSEKRVDYDEAWRIAHENFPDVDLECYGTVSDFEAEMMGLDTY